MLVVCFSFLFSLLYKWHGNRRKRIISLVLKCFLTAAISGFPKPNIGSLIPGEKKCVVCIFRKKKPLQLICADLHINDFQAQHPSWWQVWIVTPSCLWSPGTTAASRYSLKLGLLPLSLSSKAKHVLFYLCSLILMWFTYKRKAWEISIFVF